MGLSGPGRPSRLLPWLALWLSGCEPPRGVLTLPPLERVASILLVSSTQDARAVLAMDLEPGARAELELPDAPLEEVQVHLLGFECRLERLGLLPGRDPPRPQLPREVPLPAQRFALSSALDAPSPDWARVEALPAPVVEGLPIRLRDPRPCVSFDRTLTRVRAEPVPLSSPLSLPSGEVFLTGERWFVLGPEGAREVPTATLTGARAQFVDEAGEVWLADRAGRVARGHPDLGFEVWPSERSIPLPSGVGEVYNLRLSGSVAEAQPELFAEVEFNDPSSSAPRQVALFWFHGGRWDTLLEPVPARFGGGVAAHWWAPGEALFGTPHHAGVLYAREGRLIEQALPSASTDRPSVFLPHSELGLLIGTRAGALVGGSPGDWRLLRKGDAALGALPLSSMVPLGKGVAFTNTQNELLQWFDADPDCARLRVLLDGVQGNVTMSAYGEGLVVLPIYDVPGPEAALNGELHLLEPVPADPCVLDDGDRGAGWAE